MLHDQATIRDNHERFLRRVVESETVWGLDTGCGFAWCESNEADDREVIVFWSDRAYAERAQKTEFTDCSVKSISLFDYLFRWLPGMANDEVFAGTNWTADLAGLEIEPEDLQEQILNEMPPEMISRYQDELRRGIEDQNRSQ